MHLGSHTTEGKLKSCRWYSGSEETLLDAWRLLLLRLIALSLDRNSQLLRVAQSANQLLLLG